MSEATKSCSTCPSYEFGADVVARWRKSPGAPMCARYGRVLTMPDAEEESQRKGMISIASSCDAYGKPKPAAPERADFTVALPMPTFKNPSVADARVTSCMSCENLITDGVVRDQWGWLAGMCAAKGRLIFPQRMTQEARNCPTRVFGSPIRQVEDLGDVTVLPLYTQGMSRPVDIVAQIIKSQDNLIDPTEYPTDQPVSPEDEAHGVRAWRKVEDPEGTGNFVFLPIYRLDYFTDEDQAKVPRTGDDEHPELYLDHHGYGYQVAVMWTALDETPALHGIAGTGKTEFYRYMAWLMCLPFERISITSSSELDDLEGKLQFDPERGTYPQYGRVPKAWQRPCVMVLDEPNTGPLEVWQFLRPLTDNSKQLVLDSLNGEVVKRNDDCYLGMAMNPAWDIRNKGTEQLADADGNRLMHLKVDLPPRILEERILRERAHLDGYEVTDATIKTIMDIAEELRALSDTGSLEVTWGIRQQIKVVRATRWFGLLTCYRRAAADYLDPAQSDQIMDIVRAKMEG